MSLMSLRSRSRICLMNLMIYYMEEVEKEKSQWRRKR